MHPLLVATLVIAGAVAITVYAFSQGLPFVHRFTLYAVVGDAVNVRGGDPVRIDGVDVGQVQGVSADAGASKIQFTLAGSALPIHRDATVTIRDRLFLEGGYYLQLDPGSPRAPALRDRGTIPISHTSGPVQLYQLLSLFTSPVRQSLVQTVDALERGFGARPGAPLWQTGAAGLKELAPELAPVLRDTALITRGLRGTQPFDLSRFLHSTASVTRTLAGSSKELVGLVEGLHKTASALASSDGALARTISGLDRTLAAAPPSLAAVNAALPAVRRLARALDPSLLASPPILDKLTGVVARLAAVLAPMERGPLLVSLSATFKELPQILTRFARAFPVGKQVTDCLLRHVLPILVQKVPDGPLSTGRTVLGDFTHFLPGVAGASGSFDADGPYTRFLAGGGPNTLTGTFDGTTVASTAPPGGGAIQGARPHWVGDLKPADFRPDVSCTSQKVPGLAASTAPADLVPRGSQ